MDLKFQVQLKIQRPVAEVFDGVVNPAKLSGYFVQKSSGPLREGTTVQWTFAEVPGDHDIVVRRVVANETIVFEWAAAEGGYNTTVEMTFVPLDAQDHDGADRRVGLARHGGRAGRLVRQLRRLDAHGPVPQGVPRARHQPAGRRRPLTAVCRPIDNVPGADVENRQSAPTTR